MTEDRTTEPDREPPRYGAGDGDGVAPEVAIRVADRDAPGTAARADVRRPRDVDRHVGARIRDRRLALGLSQQEMAGLVGVTYQQVHKYEHGTNRISAGRLHTIARALGVGVGHFFEDLEDGAAGAAPGPGAARGRGALLGLTRDFVAMPDRRHQEAFCRLARALADPEAGPGERAA